MTKSELRNARRAARAAGKPLVGELALLNGTCTGPKKAKRVYKSRGGGVEISARVRKPRKVAPTYREHVEVF